MVGVVRVPGLAPLLLQAVRVVGVGGGGGPRVVVILLVQLHLEMLDQVKMYPNIWKPLNVCHPPV